MHLIILTGAGHRDLVLAGTAVGEELDPEAEEMDLAVMQAEFDTLIGQGSVALERRRPGGDSQRVGKLDPTAYDLTVFRQGYGG